MSGKTMKKTKRPMRRRFRRRAKPFAALNPNVDKGLVILNKQPKQIVKFSRTIQGEFTQQTGSSVYNDFQNITVQLDDVPNYTEFTSLFSRYRITKLQVTIRMVDDVGANSLQPTCYLWRNYNSALTTPTLLTLTQTPNVYTKVLSNEDRSISIEMKPYILGNAFSGGFSHLYDKWIDINYDDVSYYGVIAFMENLSQQSLGIQTITYDIVAHIEMELQR